MTRARETGWGLALLSLSVASMMMGCSGATPGVTSSAPPTQASVPSVTIAGAADARLGSPLQMTAVVTGASNTLVYWQVNGVTGGATATGTVSTDGLYTAPGAIPTDAVVIGAVTVALPAATATQTETIFNPLPVVTSAAAMPGSGPGAFTLEVMGAGFVATSQLNVSGMVVAAALISANELRATITVNANVTSVTVMVTNPDPGGSSSGTVQASTATTTLTAAARLLDQATFGPTSSDIAHVQQVGQQGYLAEQFAAAPTLLADIATPPPQACLANPTLCEQSEWWQTVLTGNDQLRQRVAFALSEIFVISTFGLNPRAVTPYQNMLAKDAFTNFSTIMRDVTLSTGMGAYLNLLDSNKPGDGQIANENYAREFMQLFTLGLSMLNADGTPQLDSSGNPQPVYTEAQVQAFARAYTGWTYASLAGGSSSRFPNGATNYDVPLAAVESAHDTAEKTLLLGTTLPAGQSAEQDLDGALTNLFNHPNVGPFVCRQLIQHLVASNPSAAYVGRVAAVFADNGQGVRGDMQAVITAILTDSEARAGDTDPDFDGGHLREPMLYMTSVMRGLGFINTDINGYYFNAGYNTQPLGERPYSSPSVFNYFPPDYVIPGTATNAPEFGLENTASAISRLTLADSLVFDRISSFSVNLNTYGTLGVIASQSGNASLDSASLVDALGVILLHGQMPSAMREAIVNHVSTLPNIAQRVRVATYLVITSSYYKINH